MRVLMLTHRLPYAPNKGDRLRAFHMLRALRSGMDVHVLSLVHDDDEASRAGELASLAAGVTVARVRPWRNRAHAVATLATRRPLTHALLDAPGLRTTAARLARSWQPDVVFAYGSGMARLAFEPTLRDLPLVIDQIDVDAAKWRDLSRVTAWPLSWIYARESLTLGHFEAMAAARAREVLVVNEREREELRRLAPGANVRVIENGVDLEAFRPQAGPGTQPHAVFCGVMDYAPNVQGALWMARHVWPLVREQRPDARLMIVGANPVRDIRRLSEADPSIVVTGTVPAVQPYLWDAAVAVAPLHTARGVQNKVLEAVAAGLPCVMTSAVEQGVPAAVRPACTVADTAGPFAAAVAAWLDAPGPSRRAAAEKADVKSLSWAARLADLGHVFRDAARDSRARMEAA